MKVKREGRDRVRFIKDFHKKLVDRCMYRDVLLSPQARRGKPLLRRDRKDDDNDDDEDEDEDEDEDDGGKISFALLSGVLQPSKGEQMFIVDAAEAGLFVNFCSGEISSAGSGDALESNTRELIEILMTKIFASENLKQIIACLLASYENEIDRESCWMKCSNSSISWKSLDVRAFCIHVERAWSLGNGIAQGKHRLNEN
ncbi:hypothetical protein V1477_016360 [Vespula maculifrons]|uniref:Uncharacterized protein n=1 Tax=Vespula maculifrons TaxID=7453 RepID=A0ABD2BCT3_VESMC